MKLSSTALSLLALGLASSAFARDIAVVDLPKAVTNSIQKTHPGAKLIRAEEEHKNGGPMFYEVKVELKDQSRRELDVQPDGRISKTETSD